MAHVEAVARALSTFGEEARSTVDQANSLDDAMEIYRLAKESEHNCVEQIVKEVAQQFPGLRLSAGRLVYDLTPDLGWDKGKAMLWLIKRFDFRRSAVCPICIGDDRTDEDMFSATQGWGVGLVVGCAQFNTKADYCLSDQAAVFAFLEAFAGRGRYA